MHLIDIPISTLTALLLAGAMLYYLAQVATTRLKKPAQFSGGDLPPIPPLPPEAMHPQHPANLPPFFMDPPKTVLTWPMGFPTKMVEPTTEDNPKYTEIESVTQVLFRIQKLVIDDPAHFVIVDVKIGQRSQFANCHSVEASHLTERTLNFDTVQPGQTVTILVRNIGPLAKNFKATAFGLVVV